MGWFYFYSSDYPLKSFLSRWVPSWLEQLRDGWIHHLVHFLIFCWITLRSIVSRLSQFRSCLETRGQESLAHCALARFLGRGRDRQHYFLIPYREQGEEIIFDAYLGLYPWASCFDEILWLDGPLAIVDRLHFFIFGTYKGFMLCSRVMFGSLLRRLCCHLLFSRTTKFILILLHFCL